MWERVQTGSWEREGAPEQINLCPANMACLFGCEGFLSLRSWVEPCRATYLTRDSLTRRIVGFVCPLVYLFGFCSPPVSANDSGRLRNDGWSGVALPLIFNTTVLRGGFVHAGIFTRIPRKCRLGEKSTRGETEESLAPRYSP